MARIEALKHNEAAWKWAALAATIIGLEYIGDESLTHGVHRALDTNIGKILVPAAIGVTAAHFYDIIDHRWDPYYRIGGASVGKAKNVGEHGQAETS